MLIIVNMINSSLYRRLLNNSTFDKLNHYLLTNRISHKIINVNGSHELINKSYNNIKLLKVVSSPVTFAIINEEFKLNERNVTVFNGIIKDNGIYPINTNGEYNINNIIEFIKTN